MANINNETQNEKTEEKEKSEKNEKSEESEKKEKSKDIIITDKVSINCEEGYYVPTDDKKKKKCRKCSVENCVQCKGTKKANYCTACKEPYKLVYNKKKKMSNWREMD